MAQCSRNVGILIMDVVALKSIRITGGEHASGLTIMHKKSARDNRYVVTRDGEGLVEFVQVSADVVLSLRR